MKCPTCRGTGTQTLHGAAFTAEEMYEQGEEFMEDYRAGHFDHPCDDCGGAGRIDQEELELLQMERAERRMGA